MASSEEKAVALSFVWLCLALCHVTVSGREVPSHADLEAIQKNTTKEFAEETSFRSFLEPLRGNIHPNADAPNRIFHYAQVKSKSGTYFGSRWFLNMWEPDVKLDQSSSAAVWFANGYDTPDFNMIVVGWHVHPQLYGDLKTHFFIYWQGPRNATVRGCYNLECPGFLPSAPNPLIPGSILEPISTAPDGKQSYLPLQIAQDQETKDWWLYTDAKPIGHWPKKLFTSLNNGASEIDWGGIVSFIRDDSSPPMGNGKFPRELVGLAPSIKRIQYVVDSSGKFLGDTTDFRLYADSPDCYNVSGTEGESGTSAFKFHFGGPGGCKS